MKFISTFTDELPGEIPKPASLRRDVPITGAPTVSNQSRLVEDACFSYVKPTPVANPKLIAYSAELCEQIGVPEEWIQSPEATLVLAGNQLLEGMNPYAMCYGGHQFGNWAGQLGDGRAINLGEWVSPQGEHWTWQLKGAGKTPYSRFADGLAVLRSSLREYACSEAMHHLGVPTTRALSLVLSGEHVVRDMFYDGNPRKEPGAIVCRVAPSFIRFGNFEIQTARGRTDLLQSLADFTIANYFPEFSEKNFEGDAATRYAAWFTEVSRRTAKMIVEWMRVGFVHGVMNTDNMSILGLTIDYGPYGWIDNYDSDWTPNTTDFQHHRYAFGKQPQIGQWNVTQLANALYPLVNKVEPLQAGLDVYVETMSHGYLRMMLDKLGLSQSISNQEARACLEALDLVWPEQEIDMTIFFRLLSHIPNNWLKIENDGEAVSIFKKSVQPAFYDPEFSLGTPTPRLDAWLTVYRSLLQRDNRSAEQRREAMQHCNPKYVLRNFLAQEAIEAAEKGDISPLNELMQVLKFPYEEQPEMESRYFIKRPEWARTKPGCSTLSCSS